MRSSILGLAPQSRRDGECVQIVKALTAVGGFCLHAMGATYNAEFYRRWGADAAFFKLAADETAVLGYQAFLSGFSMGAVALHNEYHPWLYAHEALAGLLSCWLG